MNADVAPGRHWFDPRMFAMSMSVFTFMFAFALICGRACATPTDRSELYSGPPIASQAAAPSMSHPHVMFTAQELAALAQSQAPEIRAARAILAQTARADMTKLSDYTHPYQGCRLDMFTASFTLERSSAARAAADLAVFSAVATQDVPDTEIEEAREAATEILSAWATQADRLADAARNDFQGFCDEAGHVSEGARFEVGLVFGRGIPFLVAAYDILLSENRLGPSQVSALDRLFAVLYDIERAAMNYRAERSNLDCNRFGNHVSVQIAALAAIASLRADRPALAAIADGAGGGIAIPWSLQATRAIYAAGDKPLSCYGNVIDPSHFQQDDKVEDGEIVDRYRAGTAQTVGYPLFSLEHLVLAGLILQRAGFKPFAPIANGRSPILAALHYYGDLIESRLDAPSPQVAVARFHQYENKLVTRGEPTTEGADFVVAPFVLGRMAYPSDTMLDGVLKAIVAHQGANAAFRRLPGLYLPLDPFLTLRRP